MQNKKIEEAKELLQRDIQSCKDLIDIRNNEDCEYLQGKIKKWNNLLQYIDQLESKVKQFYDGEAYTAKQLKKVEENQKKYFINKQVIRDKIELYKRLELESFNRDSIQADEYRAIIKVLLELLEEK